MKKRILCFLFSIICVLALFPVSVFASTNDTFDNSDVYSDLAGLNANEMFANMSAEQKFGAYFVEYAYSAGTSKDYALYVYVYNPSKYLVDYESTKNTLEMSLEADENGNPKNFKWYSLQYCSKTDDNLYIKYKVIDTDGTIYTTVKSECRDYYISAIDIVISGNQTATSNSIATKYSFTGFAKGYGADKNAESTISVAMTDFKTLQLKTHHTYYRVQSDSLHSFYDIQSVYFTVRDSYIQEYGDIYSLVARWKECFTTPILITNDKTVNEKMQSILREENPSMGDDPLLISYGVKTDVWETLFNPVTGLSGGIWLFMHDPVVKQIDGGVFVPDGFTFDGIYEPNLDYDEDDMLDAWNYCFKVSDSEISTPGNIVDLSDQLEEYLDEYNWDESLFAYINTDNYDIPVVIYADDLTSITEYEYDGWFFGHQFDQVAEHNFNAIVAVDLADKDLDKTEFAKKYLVAEQDVSSIQQRVREGQTVYLLRYSVTPYVAYGDDDVNIYREGSEFVPINDDTSNFEYGNGDIDAVVAQTTAIQDFDIIEVTFNKDGVYTTLAVVHDPSNFVSPLSIPQDPGVFGNNDNWWIWILIILGIILLFVVFAPLINPIISLIGLLFSALFGVIKLPFKALKKRRKNNHKNE